MLSIATRNGVAKRTLESADELVATLAAQFALDLPEAAELWPRIAARHEEIMRMTADIKND